MVSNHKQQQMTYDIHQSHTHTRLLYTNCVCIYIIIYIIYIHIQYIHILYVRHTPTYLYVHLYYGRRALQMNRSCLRTLCDVFSDENVLLQHITLARQSVRVRRTHTNTKSIQPHLVIFHFITSFKREVLQYPDKAN